MPKKIIIEHTKEIKQLNIIEGESIEIILNRKKFGSIAVYLKKKDGVCSLHFKDPDKDEKVHIFEWKDY